MKRTVCFLIAAMALPGFAESAPSGPVADPDPSAVNPFLDSIGVTLTAGGNATIYWDFGTSTTPLAPGDGHAYTAGDVIPIKATGTLRTVADFPGMGIDPITANFPYTKDTKPKLTLVSPLSQTFRVGQTVNFQSNVEDPDMPPFSVRYYRYTGTAWTELTSSALTVPPYSFAWALDANAPTGTVQLRAIAADAKGASDTAAVSITIAANKAPTANLTAPAKDTTLIYPASATLTATATDPDGSITKVEFYKGATLLGSDSDGAPWTFGPVSLGESTYAFKAIAYDNGVPVLTGTSAAKTVKVVKNSPPKVSITSPLNNKTYYAPYAASVAAAASDSIGGVAKVEFYNGAVLEATITTPTAGFYVYTKTYAAGSYALAAKATDSLGASTISDTVKFTVAANAKPIVKAGKDTTLVQPNLSYKLDGSGSNDPEGTALHYKWTAPAGVTFSNDTLANPTIQFQTGSMGPFIIQLKATDLGTPPAADSAKITVTVWAKPAITSSLTAAAVANQTFTYTLTGTGYPAPAFDAPSANRPAWLTYNAATATLSGKPTAQGPVNVGLTAQNSAGTDTKTLVITVGDSLYKPAITSALTATAKVGTAFSYAITARGNPSNFTYAATGLPAGLSLSGATISGTPTAAGPFTAALTVSNSLGSDQKNLALTVNQDPKITKDLPDSLPSILDKGSATFSVQATGYPGVSYQWQFSGSSSTAGFGPVGTNSNTYTINPASVTSSSGWYRVIVKNGVGPDVTSKACHLKVNPLPLPVAIIQSPVAQTAVVGDRVIFKAKATGEPAPLLYQWFRGYPTRTSLTQPKQDDSVYAIDSARIGMGDVYSVRVTNSTKDTVNAANFAWSDTARLTVQLPKLAKPTATPAGGTIYKPTQVTLNAPVAGATLYYTLNGQDPTQSAPSLPYANSPILIDSTRTLKARAYYPNVYRSSDVMSETYTLTAPNKSAKPVIRPADSVFTGTLTVTIVAPDGSDVYYTVDGSDPLASTVVCPPGGFVISGTTLVKAVARKSGFDASDTAMKTFVLYKPKPKVQNPVFSPDGGSFAGTQNVGISSPTPNAVVHYTDDGKDPDSTSPIVPAGGLVLAKSAQLKAIGILKDYANSDIVARDFRLGPGLITATPAPEGFFDAQIAVKLAVTPSSAVIRYTLDGSLPSDQSPIFPPEGITLTTTATISAIAYLGLQPGVLQTFSYTLNHGTLLTPIPSSGNNAFTFKDSLLVTLRSSPGARIYYTLDGSEPAVSPANLYQGPFVLDRTATVEAVAVEDGFENSKVLVATYTLVPEKPGISPPGGSYPMPIKARLFSSSRTALLYYTTNGSAPTPENGQPYVRGTDILITQAGTLKAVAVAGNMASEVATEVYGETRLSDTTLAPGTTFYVGSGYTLRNPEDELASAQVHIGNPSSVGLEGFDGVQYTMTLSLSAASQGAGAPFPKLTFTSPSSETRSLYKLEPSGKIFFISSADTVTLGPGTFFMGNDTMPPRIKYIAESYDPSDSTRVTFEVSDNVTNLTYSLNRKDDSTRDLAGASLFSGQQISAQLKNPPGAVKPLYVRLIASDYRKTAYFPADPSAMLSVSQRWTPLQGPAAWKIGANPKNLYDFIGIPMALDPPLTLDGLRSLNPGVAIEGADFDSATNKFRSLDKAKAMAAGQGFWIAARAPVTSLRMPQASTLPSGGKTGFSLVLHHGWNQISDPHLATLYWPFRKPESGDLVKRLWAWDATLPNPFYAESDSLVPWRGYFVLNYGGDSVIPLLTRPPVRAASAKAAAGDRIMVSLGWDGRAFLRLGADAASKNGLGIEDEQALPQRGDRFLRAMRDGRALSSDWVKLDRQGVQSWQVEFGSSGDSLPALGIADLSLPEGDEAWALSFSRGMKFPLAAGASIPASGLAQDSLIVIAGPREKIAALDWAHRLSETPPTLDAQVAQVQDGFRLRLALPSRARVRAMVFSLQGARLGSLSTGLISEGTYDFAYSRDFADRASRLGPGLYVVSVDVRGQGVSARLSRKLLIAR